MNTPALGRLSLCALALLSLTAACSSDPAPTRDAAADLPAADVSIEDAPSQDASTRDVSQPDVTDAAPDVGIPIACDQLGSYCHDVDPGDGPLHDCHEGGHAPTAMWCADNAARCYALCTNARDAGADAGHAHDDAAADAAADAAHMH